MVPVTVAAGAAARSVRAAGAGVVADADSEAQPRRTATTVAGRTRERRIAEAPPRKGEKRSGSCASDAVLATGTRPTPAHVGVVHRSLQGHGTRRLDPPDDVSRP